VTEGGKEASKVNPEGETSIYYGSRSYQSMRALKGRENLQAKKRKGARLLMRNSKRNS
jgi:hypothetical protein